MNMRSNEGLPEHHIHSVVGDLAIEFDTRVDEQEVRRAVEEAFGSYAESRIRTFVPILARRTARERLRARLRGTG